MPYDNDREFLVEALGRANTALTFSRMLLQLLGERGVIPPSLLLEGLDGYALILEESLQDSRATLDLAVQLRETLSAIAELDALPVFRDARDGMRR